MALSELDMMSLWEKQLRGYKSQWERLFGFGYAAEAAARKQDDALIQQMHDALCECAEDSQEQLDRMEAAKLRQYKPQAVAYQEATIDAAKRAITTARARLNNRKETNMNSEPTTSYTDDPIELAIKQAGADKAPRVTPDDLKANIVGEFYFTAAEGVDGADIGVLRAQDQAAPLTLAPMADDPPVWRTGDVGPLHLLTFCVLVLKNGFTVTGESACASPENFNAEIGRKIARENAVAKVWPLMGYALKERLAGEQA